MTSLAYAKAMADNRWMNNRLYECCAQLSDAERKRDVGAFFKSIHGTLNHLLLGDRIWLGRFMVEPFQFRSLDQELYPDFTSPSRPALCSKRRSPSARISSTSSATGSHL